LLNVSETTEFFKWINGNGDTDYAEIAEWFNAYTYKALADVGLDACDVHILLRKYDPTFKI